MTGSKVDFRGTIKDRLMSRVLVNPDTGCWIWTGTLSAGSYGSLFYEGRMQKAHRISWRISRGEIPDGLELDHLCRVRRCVNPDHLEPVTRSENLLRSPLMDRYSTKTHCVHGHEFTPENTRIITILNSKERVCRECRKINMRNWRAKQCS